MNLLDLAVKIGVDDQASSKIEGIAGGIKDKVGSAFATVGKLAAGVGVAAGGAAVAIGTAAAQSFASYEQLAGGVDKLYGDASDKLKQYAMDGAKTAGMSMNDYMQQATSFSAALINSLGGDVDKAADQTDKAMRLMSDNVNTFGTDAEAVQNAIQGLSRENYTMLDNLKLGYAGTKEGMQQLIDDANEYAKEQGINADLTMGNFSDMIDAIDLIQQKQNIWGTTNREAMTTIEGSIGMVKASWENLLTAFGTGDQSQIESAINGITEGLFGAFNVDTGKLEGGLFNNLLPVFQRVGESLAGQMPLIAERVAQNFIYALGTTFGLDLSWMDEFFYNLEQMGERAKQAAQEFASAFTENASFDGFVSLFQTVMDAAGGFFDFLTSHAGDIGATLGGAVDVLSQIDQGVSDFFSGFGASFDGSGFGEALQGFMEGLQNVWTFVQDNILAHSEEIGAFVGQVATIIGDIAGKAGELFAILSPYLPFIAAFAGVFGVLMPLISTVTTVIGAISGAVTFLTTVILPALGMIQSIPGLIAVITTVLGGPITIIAAIVAAIIAFLATNEDARAKVLEVWEAVKQKFFEVKDAIGQKIAEIGEFFNNLKDTVSQKLEEVIGFFSSLPDNILGALGDLGGLLFGVGESIINGLWDGLRSMWDNVSSWFGSITDAIPDLKGPKQRDLKLLTKNGQWIMQGLDEGLKKGFLPVEDTLGSFTDTIGGFDASLGVKAVQAPSRDSQVMELLAEIRDNMNMQVYLDGKALVGGIAPRMDRAMARL